ncbi:MAG TPA: HAMP domain-containing histidine kinase [Candidatus Scybalocola faecigallinarum]|uniref:histidine kinase n=1 Tax=Candidatus Scybalocola faecigallinarum TaxID=2840941 RepID=A0A9D1F260_9FIRM|nr:HAMP domain-containing histidine kinase [Candidatus Scybalocola faecigallinarum]
MHSITKLIRRFAAILFISTLLILILNIVLFFIFASRQTGAGVPWSLAQSVALGLTKEADGYVLSDAAQKSLDQENVWAIYIDNETMSVVWHTNDLPEEIPKTYTIGEISALTRGYLKDYPTFTAGTDEGLVVVGYPKDRYWKHLYPVWDLDTIKNAPMIFLSVLGINVTAIFLIYVAANSGLLRQIRPIAEGIAALPTQQPVYVRERGLLSDLARDLNETAEILQAQKVDLRKKEMARANWISGVSHDIRTPLSMVLGYAAQMEEDPCLSEEIRKKASMIRRQSLKMKNLIRDLNLASKLEYHMQPMSVEPVSLRGLARQCAADFINSDLEEKYPLQWQDHNPEASGMIHGDKSLLLRAVNNVLNNVLTHNPDGCHVTMAVGAEKEGYYIMVEDDGKGISEEMLEKLRKTPHYMFSDSAVGEARHGLGLLIVRQIIRVHEGRVTFDHGSQGGFCVKMYFPGGKGSGEALYV